MNVIEVTYKSAMSEICVIQQLHKMIYWVICFTNCVQMPIKVSKPKGLSYSVLKLRFAQQATAKWSGEPFFFCSSFSFTV